MALFKKGSGKKKDEPKLSNDGRTGEFSALPAEPPPPADDETEVGPTESILAAQHQPLPFEPKPRPKAKTGGAQTCAVCHHESSEARCPVCHNTHE